MMSMLIEENDVSVINLSVELERAVIQHEMRDNESLYVTEDGMFPFWISVNSATGLVLFRTHTNFKNASSQMQRLELCNELNMKQYLVTAYVMDDRLYVDYVLNFRDGLLRETFIRTCRQFSSNVKSGLSQIDSEHEIALAPGDSEAEA